MQWNNLWVRNVKQEDMKHGGDFSSGCIPACLHASWRWIAGNGSLLVLLPIAGCTVGPDYHRPPTTMPTAYASPISATTKPTTHPSEPTTREVDAAQLAQWWMTFDDPHLTSLVERAIPGNLNLQQAQSRIRQARAQRDIATGALWPDVDASGSAQRSRARGSGTHNLFQAGLDASWEIDIFGGNRRNVEAATADFLASVENRRDVMVSLVSEVAVDYIALRRYQRQITIAQNNLVSQRRSVEVTRKRFEGGFASGLDVANAEAQVASTESQIPVLQSAARQTIYAMGVLLGEQPQELVDELEKDAPIPGVPAEIPVGLPSDLLQRRPDIRLAEAQLHAATARIGVAKADLFPKFSLTGSLGVRSDRVGSLANWNNRYWSVGPSVSWPLFDAGAIRANIRVQNEVQYQALLTYRGTVLQALADVDSALTAFTREQEHHAALLRAEAANRRAVDLAIRLYTDGQTDFLNVVSAQSSLYASQNALAQSQADIATDLVSLYKALGGGWDTHVNGGTTDSR